MFGIYLKREPGRRKKAALVAAQQGVSAAIGAITLSVTEVDASFTQGKAKSRPRVHRLRLPVHGGRGRAGSPVRTPRRRPCPSRAER
ncbi:hypothetical protein ACWDBW_28125 [Streptomyces sp. NPDC001107]